MYNSHIGDKELKAFHEVFANNFTITLTDILTSDLFKVEQITNTIYRIYPLFYTQEIYSSNSNDKILDNQCIICEKTDKETYITCISDENKETQEYNNYTTYKAYIGQTLSQGEFNGIVSLLRKSITHKESFKINNEVNGKYGEYLFNIDNVTIIDNGILITNKTLTAGFSVKLLNNLFSHSTYKLILKVVHMNAVNVLDDYSDDFKVIDTLEIILAPDEWVEIPLSNLENGNIISFDSIVEIKHDKPEILLNNYQLILTATKSIIQTDETTQLTATLLNNNVPVSGTPVTFEVYHNDVLMDTLTGATNNDGECSVGYVGKGTGDLNIKCQVPARSLLSETYVYDCLFYDTGILGSNNSEYFNYYNRLDIDVTETCTVLTGKTLQDGYLFVNLKGTSKSSKEDVTEIPIPFQADITILDFDITDTNSGLYVNDSSTERNVFFNGKFDSNDCLIHFEHTGKYFNVWVNGEKVVNNYMLPTAQSGLSRFAIRVMNGKSLKFKDFKVYPI